MCLVDHKVSICNLYHLLFIDLGMLIDWVDGWVDGWVDDWVAKRMTSWCCMVDVNML